MQLAASLGSKGGLPPPQANLLAFEKLVELNYGVWRGGWVTGGGSGLGLGDGGIGVFCKWKCPGRDIRAQVTHVWRGAG